MANLAARILAYHFEPETEAVLPYLDELRRRGHVVETMPRGGDGKRVRDYIDQHLTNWDCILLFLMSSKTLSYNEFSDLEEIYLYQTVTSNLLILAGVATGMSVPGIVLGNQWIQFGANSLGEDVAQIEGRIEAFLHRPQEDEGVNYWLIKINGNTWPVNSFEPGFNGYFNSYHHQGKKTEDYALFERVKQGDKILGYVYGTYDAVSCIFEVTKPLYSDPIYGEIIAFVIVQVFETPIASNVFELLGLPTPNFNAQVVEKLILVTPEQYATVVKAPVTPGQIYLNPSSISLIHGDTAVSAMKDNLQIMDDVRALASVIAYREVIPPLAIGLFGNWGMGKSFFMAKLKDQIDDFSKKDLFCKEVVHINFNSWHYSDSNLWASLITRIFDGLKLYGQRKDASKLDTLFENLSSTKEQLEDAKSKKADIEKTIETLTEEKKKVEETIQRDAEGLKNMTVTQIAAAVMTDNEIKNDFDALKKKYDFLQLNEYKDIDGDLKTLESGGNKLMKSIELIATFRTGKKWVAILFAVLFLGIFYLLSSKIEWVRSQWPGVKAIFALIAAGLSQLVVFLGPVLKIVNEAHRRLASLSSKMKQVEKEEERKFNFEREQLKEKIANAVQTKQDIETRVSELSSRKVQLEQDIQDISSGKKIVHFIENRVSDKRYIDNLGIISWIRKDFEELDFLLKQQHDARKLEELQKQKVDNVFEIDRIILYIDDLDRCEIPIVVRVLEAIHLLLAFPLFVVIVGVDPRWMFTALTQKYKGLVATDDETETSETPFVSGETRMATSYDYLEKIFQIPFVLKPMNSAGRNELIQYQFGKMDGSGGKTKVATVVEGMTSAGVTEKKDPEVPEKKETVQTDLGGAAKTSGGFEVGGNASQAAEEVLLQVTQDEIEFMQTISQLIGDSPRVIKRYINIYRIIRTHAAFELNKGTEIDDYCAAMILLGFQTGLPAAAGLLFDRIESAQPGQLFGQWLEDCNKTAGISTQDMKLLVLLAKTLETEDNAKSLIEMKLGRFRKNMKLIKRFSFRCYLQGPGGDNH